MPETQEGGFEVGDSFWWRQRERTQKERRETPKQTGLIAHSSPALVSGNVLGLAVPVLGSWILVSLACTDFHLSTEGSMSLTSTLTPVGKVQDSESSQSYPKLVTSFFHYYPLLHSGNPFPSRKALPCLTSISLSWATFFFFLNLAPYVNHLQSLFSLTIHSGRGICSNLV